MVTLTSQQAVDQAPAGWALLLGGLQTRVALPDFATGASLVAAIGAAVRPQDRPPEVTLRARALEIRVGTGGPTVTTDDLRLAREVSTLVEEAGLACSSRGTTRFELGLDTPDRDEIAGFWAAVLHGERGSGAEADDWGTVGGGNDEVHDPAEVLPTVWFQRSGAEEPRQRWHPDVWIDPSEVAERIRASLDAGGAMVSDAEAPAFWVLADPQGNRVCLCTWQARD